MGQVDWVIVCVKSTSLDAIPDLIYPLLKPETRVVAIMNGLIEDDLIAMLKEKAKEPAEDVNSPLSCCRALYGGTVNFIIKSTAVFATSIDTISYLFLKFVTVRDGIHMLKSLVTWPG